MSADSSHSQVTTPTFGPHQANRILHQNSFIPHAGTRKRELKIVAMENLSNKDASVNENVTNNRLNNRPQWHHIGMQPVDHLSIVVFRNRTRKPQFCAFQENVNHKVWIVSIFVILQYESFDSKSMGRGGGGICVPCLTLATALK